MEDSQVFAEIAQASVGKQEKVEFQEKFLLIGWLVRIIPNEALESSPEGASLLLCLIKRVVFGLHLLFRKILQRRLVLCLC